MHHKMGNQTAGAISADVAGASLEDLNGYSRS